MFNTTKSETARQNKTNFESKLFLSSSSLSYLFVIANSPSVSITNKPSQLFISLNEPLFFANLKYVPYTPRVHLPSLVAKSHPNKKFNRVDLPEL